MSAINILPAYTKNSININNAIDNLENLFENLNKFEKENGKDAKYGYAGIPSVLKRVREAGSTSIFLFSKNYSSHYEDDDCNFTYWDEQKKEFFNDGWSTRYAAPNFDYYEMPINFSDGWNMELIDKLEYLKIIKAQHIKNLDKVSFDANIAKNYKLRVKVDGGRKWKGEGILINVEESSYRYAAPMFRNHCEGYGVNTTYIAIIWNPIDNTINRCNYKYVEFLDSEEIMKEYKNWAEIAINSALVDNIDETTFDLKVNYSFENFMENKYKNSIFNNIAENAYDPEEEERKRKASEFRASKMPGIIEWVKNNTDKKGEEIMKLAIHIFNKKYC